MKRNAGANHGWVLLGDMIDSRGQRDRARLSERVDRALGSLTGEPGDPGAWHTAPRRTRGVDEFSGVLLRPDGAFRVVMALAEALDPTAFRVALAPGRIDVPDEQVALMDGPAFHAAARELQRAKDERKVLTLHAPGVDPAWVALVEGAANLAFASWRRWTPKRREVLRAYRAEGTQERAGERLGVSQAAVSDALRAAGARELLEAEDALERALARVGRLGG